MLTVLDCTVVNAYLVGQCCHTEVECIVTSLEVHVHKI